MPKTCNPWCSAAGLRKPTKSADRCCGVVLLAATLLLGACGSREQPQAVTPVADATLTTPEAPAATPAAQTARDVVMLANAAFRDSRIVAPAGDNALEYTWRALRIEPDNAGATEILVDITPIAASAVEAEIAAGRLPEAARIMNLLSAANPDSFTVKNLQQRLERTRALAEVIPAPTPLPAPTPPPRPTTESPSAVSTAPTTEVSRPAASPPPPTVPVARSSAAEENPTTRATIAARPVVAEPAPSNPQPAPRTPAAAKASTTSEPVPIQKVAPEYPAAARKRRTEGWVELQFMVGVDGTPSQVEVLRAEPASMFDRAAIRAVSRWKFKPAERDGRSVEAMARTTINFKLN